MKLRLLSTCVALIAITACATASKNVGIDPAATGDGGTGDGGGIVGEDGEEDPALQPPHSLGSIVLGEAHGTGAGGSTRSTPIVTATFLPDAMLTKSCKKKIEGGCEILAVAKCTQVTTTSTGCPTSEVCTLDDTCASVCKPTVTAVACEEGCGADEVCKPSTTAGKPGTCVKVQTFDAGPLAFSGTTTTITMFPPYRFETTGQGAPFLGGSELRVQAQGALEAGFEAFDEKFTATTFVQTSPPLSKITRAVVFGTGAVPVGWAPSAGSAGDSVIVTVSGPGGTATCKMKDAVAKFDIPRAIVKAAQGEDAIGTTPVSISITRQRKEIHKDKKAKGELATTPVKPEAWLELVTQSTETTSFQGCTGSGQTLCDDTCTDLKFDAENCGTCGKVCGSTQTCNTGVCTGNTTGCVSCKSNARAGVCSSQAQTCNLDIACSDLSFCIQNCTTAACVSTCNSTYPTGVGPFAALNSCWNTQCASACPF
jgi:hypothetical protein